MKIIKIQSNTLFAISTATTQEDNFGGIDEKYKLFDDEECYYQPRGKLVKYTFGTYALFINGLRIDLNPFEVKFIK